MVNDWHKLRLAIPPPCHGLMHSHAMVPTPLVLSDRIRVFFAACDITQRGRVFFADLDRFPPFKVQNIVEEPVLGLGRPGDFDCDGVNPCHLVVSGDRLYLYYVGWQRGMADNPYTLLTGLAISTDNGLSFERSPKPLLPPSRSERLFRTAPYVYFDGTFWCMLYIGGSRFITGEHGKKLPHYSLLKVRSTDGNTWPARGAVLLDPEPGSAEIGFGRPIRWHDARKRPVIMLSIRSCDGYRLVQAPESSFGSGRPTFEDVVAPGEEGWDSQMTCFAAPCLVDDCEVLFYNGNEFGKTGIGIATRPALD